MGGTHRESGDDLLEHQYLCRLRLRIAASCLAQLPHLLAEPRGLVDQLLTLLQQGVQRLRHGRQLVAVRGHRQGREGLRLDLELSKYTNPRPAAHGARRLDCGPRGKIARSSGGGLRPDRRGRAVGEALRALRVACRPQAAPDGPP